MLKAILVFLFIIVVVVIGLSIAVLSPKVQTYVAHKAAHYLSEKTGADVRVGNLTIRPFRTVRLKDVYFSDLQKDTLFSIGHLDARLSNFNIFDIALHFDKVELFDVHANIYRNEGDENFNFHFLNKLFSSDKPKKEKTGNPLVFSVKVLDTRNINFSWDDKKTGQFYYGRFDRLLIDAEEADLKNKTFTLNSVLLEKPDVRLRMYNLKKTEKDKTDVSLDLGFRIKFKEFNLVDGFFALKTKEESLPSKMPLNVFDFAVRDIQVQIKDGRWDSIALADIRMISAKIGDDIVLKELSGKGSADSTHTAMQDMVLRYNESVISLDTRLEYSALNDYRDFMNAVFWQGKIKDLDVKKNDIAMWLPADAKKYLVDVKMKGDIQGTFSNIRLENMEIRTGSQTVIAGKASVKGLPNIDQMLLDVQLDRLNTSIAELKRLMPYVKFPAQLDKLGNVSFKGAYFGFVNDFVAYGKLKTAVGDVSSDIKISFDKRTKMPYYSGVFSGYNVDPGAFLKGNKILGKANFDLKLDGQGFNIDQLASNVTGTISSLEVKGYTYQDIHLEGRVDKKLFTGTVNIDDPCVFFNFDGTVDFNNPSPVYKAQTQIRDADLQGLNLTKDKLIVSMDGYIDVQGKSLNDLNGQIDLTDISLVNDKSSFEMSETRITLAADSLSEYKEYVIASEEISAWVKGNFDPVKVGPQFMKYLGGYSVWLPQKNELELKEQSFTAHFEMDDDFGIVSFFVPKFERFHNLYLNASFDNTTDDFTIDVSVDSVFYDGMGAYNFSLDGGMSGNSIVLFALTDRLTIAGKKSTQTIPLIQAGISSSYDSLLVDLGVEHDTAINSIRLQTIIDRFGDSTTFKVLSSRLRVNNKDWTIAPNNSLLLHGDQFFARNFTLLQGDQSIRIINSNTSLSDAKIEFDNFNLGDVGQLLPNDSILQAGRLFGTLTLLNPLKSLQADADLRFTGLRVFGFEGGDINVVASYVDSSKVVTGKGKIDGEDFKLTFDGVYDINGDDLNSANIDADIEKASLRFLELILKNEISNTSGYVKGKINFTGSPKQPMLSGTATVIDTARTTVNFLGANFRFANEEIIIRPTEFDFGNITLWDPDGNTATVNGLLKHQYFKDFEIDLNINTEKFMLMNTTAKDNQDYYGTAYAKADIAMFGPVNNLNIDIQARTLPNTVFSIPLAKLSNTETYNFIQFRARGDTTTSVEEPYRSVLKGVNLNFDLEVTRDALLRIIFNPATNDMITARGYGDLEIDIASAGDFNIFGTLAIDEGQYLFTFQNIINKRFDIKPGGSISWTGEPENALLNIDALYKTKVRIDNALGDSSSVSSRSIPIDLEMKLTGDLSNTEINFNIVPTGLDFSSQSDEVNALLNQLREDKNLMNTQVFGILLFNRFLPSGTNTVASGNLGAEFAGNTVTELLSNQLSMYLNDAISQFTKNLELDFNFRTGNFNNTQDRDEGGIVSELDLGLKTKLFNDRVIVNVGGTFDFGRTDPGTAQQSNAGIAGDFVVEYLLSADGRIRLKAFHRTSEYDIFGEQRSKTGASIYYRKDFDRLRELFQREKRRLKKEGK